MFYCMYDIHIDEKQNSCYLKLFVQTQEAPVDVKVIRVAFSKYFPYDIWGVVVLNTP